MYSLSTSMLRRVVVTCFFVGCSLASVLLLSSAFCTPGVPEPFRPMDRHRRRSRRLQGQAPPEDVPEGAGGLANNRTAKRKAPPTAAQRKAALRATTATHKKKKTTTTLPRTLERKIMEQQQHHAGCRMIVLGVDEAGRGPLAGPVVAAAVHLSTTTSSIEGIVDSKRITKEDTREALYEAIVHTMDNDDVQWAIAIVDAPTIDRVNILQATLLGMRWAVQTVMGIQPLSESGGSAVPIHPSASIDHQGCYLITNQALPKPSSSLQKDTVSSGSPTYYHALIDGPHLPAAMPCPADAIVRGDAREYCIAAAAILAKVTRDRLLRSYAATLYPAYGLERHKGYPTQAHVQALREHGPTPIHRRSFAPLKEWIKEKEVEDTPGETSATAEE